MSAYTTEVLDMKLGGMVCHSCEDVIAAALLAERGVVDAEVSYYKSAARVKYDPAIVTPERLEQCVKNAGYGVGGSGLGGVAADAICAAAVILLTWLLTRYAKPGAPVMSAGMSLLQVLLLGMVTSVHCLGMCGGIAMAQGGGIDVGRGAELRAAAAYNLGRVAAYTAVGALCGGLGAAISYGAQTKSMVFTLAGAAVALMGVNLSGSAPALRRLAAQLMPRRRGLPKGGAPLIAGLATGLMPCGSLYAMWTYAVGTGSAVRGAAVMLCFALGTVPALFLLGVCKGLVPPKLKKYAARVSSVLVTAMGLKMLIAGLKLGNFI
ncbi:MAG: sulfite exporter TauE/SafE family protein [Oscillospiraceae bacterium]